MLQAVLVPHTALLIEEAPKPTPSVSLQSVCVNLLHVRNEQQLSEALHSAELVIVHTAIDRMIEYQALVVRTRKLPIFWYSQASADLPSEIEWGHALDGLLFPSMTKHEVNYAIKWGIRCFQQRKHWNEERDQLLQRIGERKWIDQAKSVLCEIKGISEAEAYDFLRKQAMNERKRIGDIAANIVKVYQLIHG